MRAIVVGVVLVGSGVAAIGQAGPQQGSQTVVTLSATSAEVDDVATGTVRFPVDIQPVYPGRV